MEIILGFSLITNTPAQTLQFTSIRVLADEGVQLYWKSKSNTVYRIEYASELADENTEWGVLYDDYPSHGTNTFWMDTGDYDHVPAIPYFTKDPMRFYRILDKGTNSAAAPSVTISSPTNGATLFGDITVSVVATSPLPFVSTSLFVDGQEMDSSDDGTNYIINTCEWPNGPHVLFATARAQSVLSGPSGPFRVDIGRGVSAYKSVTFDNLIHTVAFSEPFFEPSLGQTQQVSAAFAANVNWTLQMIDESSNALRTVTGSGTSLQYSWDGTGDGGAIIPDGVYYYLISAQTNGQAFMRMASSGGASESLTSLIEFNSSKKLSEDWYPTSAKEAMMVGRTSYFSSPPPMPPVRFKKDGKWSYVPYEDLYGPQPLTEMKVPVKMQEKFLAALGGSSLMNSSSAFAAYSGPSGQDTVAPKKPPTKPVKNAVGMVGVAFYDFAKTNFVGNPRNGLPLTGNGGKVQIEGAYGTFESDPIPEAPTTAKKFVTRMAKAKQQIFCKLIFHLRRSGGVSFSC